MKTGIFLKPEIYSLLNMLLRACMVLKAFILDDIKAPGKVQNAIIDRQFKYWSG